MGVLRAARLGGGGCSRSPVHVDEPAGLVPSFQLTRVSGAPTVGARTIDDQDLLKVGHWLETGSDGRAAITVANIGQVRSSRTAVWGC